MHASMTIKHRACCKLLQTNSGATIFPLGLRQNVTAVMLRLLNQGIKLSNLSPAAFETAGKQQGMMLTSIILQLLLVHVNDVCTDAVHEVL